MVVLWMKFRWKNYQLYMASHEYQRAVVCVWDSDDYFCVLESAASKAGLCLDEAAQLDVQLPEAEFDENMISGGFQVWKGLSVDLRNDPLESLIEEICHRLKKRGFSVNCTLDEEVAFCLPINRRS